MEKTDEKKKHILIVEDELQFAEMVKLRLEIMGYSASIAVDTNEGIHKIMTDQYDLIVLDLMMPGGGGTKLLERIKADPEKGSIPVVVVTGKTITPEIKKQLEDHPVARTYIKPYNPIQFVSGINDLLT